MCGRAFRSRLPCGRGSGGACGKTPNELSATRSCAPLPDVVKTEFTNFRRIVLVAEPVVPQAHTIVALRLRTNVAFFRQRPAFFARLCNNFVIARPRLRGFAVSLVSICSWLAISAIRFHPRAQRDAFRHRDARQQSRLVRPSESKAGTQPQLPSGSA
jgi:hypothetical protein